MSARFTNVEWVFDTCHMYETLDMFSDQSITQILPAWQLQPITGSIDLRFQRNILFRATVIKWFFICYNFKEYFINSLIVF